MPRDGGFAHVSCLAEQARILCDDAAMALCEDWHTLDDLREAVTTLVETERIKRGACSAARTRSPSGLGATPAIRLKLTLLGETPSKTP